MLLVSKTSIPNSFWCHEMVLRVRKRMGQAIKFSSFGLHVSEPFHDMALEQYEMERGEQVHISMSEIAAG